MDVDFTRRPSPFLARGWPAATAHGYYASGFLVPWNVETFFLMYIYMSSSHFSSSPIVDTGVLIDGPMGCPTRHDMGLAK